MKNRELYRNTYNETKKNENKIFGLSDMLLIAILILGSIGLLFFYYISETKAADPRLEILVRNVRYGVYDLDEDQTIEIQGTNICEIKNGVVSMIDADCPDQLCIHQMSIDRNGGNIICLPNQVILHIIDADDMENQADTIAG